MQKAQCKICPYCKSVQSLDSRYCSQCSEVLDESTYSTLFKYKNTIAITALGTTCAFLIIVLFAYFGSKPKSPASTVTGNENKQISGGPTNTAANNPAANTANSELRKLQSQKPPTPTPLPEVITDDEPETTSPDKTESKRKTPETSDDSDIESYPSRDYQTGPRGGCYYISGSGSKVYVDRSFCGGPAPKSNPDGYIRGPRGGCYYINSSGNKTYVDRSLCN
jgi:hypothetical protein